MKKKKAIKKRKQSKIDVVLESLLNLEQKVKELIQKVEQLQYNKPYYPDLPPPQSPPKYWPVDYPKYKDVTWDAIDKGLQ
ncbi:hypothetical protein EB001_13460 [bacterium]|nr:hypothetical protein [bacterium]